MDSVEQTTPAASKQQHKVSYSIFEAAVKELSSDNTTLCKAIGYDGTAWRNWKEQTAMPMVASLACEALRRRNGKGFSKTILVRAMNQAHFDAITAVCKGLGAEFVDI